MKLEIAQALMDCWCRPGNVIEKIGNRQPAFKDEAGIIHFSINEMFMNVAHLSADMARNVAHYNFTNKDLQDMLAEMKIHEEWAEKAKARIFIFY